MSFIIIGDEALEIDTPLEEELARNALYERGMLSAVIYAGSPTCPDSYLTKNILWAKRATGAWSLERGRVIARNALPMFVLGKHGWLSNAECDDMAQKVVDALNRFDPSPSFIVKAAPKLAEQVTAFPREIPAVWLGDPFQDKPEEPEGETLVLDRLGDLASEIAEHAKTDGSCSLSAGMAEGGIMWVRVATPLRQGSGRSPSLSGAISEAFASLRAHEGAGDSP